MEKCHKEVLTWFCFWILMEIFHLNRLLKLTHQLIWGHSVVAIEIMLALAILSQIYSMFFHKNIQSLKITQTKIAPFIKIPNPIHNSKRSFFFSFMSNKREENRVSVKFFLFSFLFGFTQDDIIIIIKISFSSRFHKGGNVETHLLLFKITALKSFPHFNLKYLIDVLRTCFMSTCVEYDVIMMRVTR